MSESRCTEMPVTAEDLGQAWAEWDGEGPDVRLRGAQGVPLVFSVRTSLRSDGQMIEGSTVDVATTEGLEEATWSVDEAGLVGELSSVGNPGTLARLAVVVEAHHAETGARMVEQALPPLHLWVNDRGQLQTFLDVAQMKAMPGMEEHLWRFSGARDRWYVSFRSPDVEVARAPHLVDTGLEVAR